MNYLPIYLKQIFLGFGNPSEIFLKLLDCVLSQIIWFQDNQYIYLYFRIVILLIFNFLICLFTLICFRILKNKDLLVHTSVLIYFIIHLFTHTIDSTLGMIFCVKVDDQFYINQHPSIKCDEVHLSFVKKMLIPCLCIQLLFIFLVFLYIIRENQNKTNSRKISSIFNQFYKHFWWYFYQILIRLLIIAIDNYFFFDVYLKGSVLCSLYLSYTLTQLYCKIILIQIQNFILKLYNSQTLHQTLVQLLRHFYFYFNNYQFWND
ncbi:transmembrane protein, putative (macronuclear) [Tetrahymena thermophila SB210]|uniref:Transmembrane protein, putative n=1 Tax=Tetrahymena thermophila (strain SB210) TaxID=312017 RepID=W7XCA3_TETTS|nr:transmembrane protein, putative [Tetrahymena thermophila SB210]EWS74173.1 transmembrane protein, putative [Tetrahymena thermophila SB210]|eukprot:XP_012653294.1 transmembrane protein, putative [Tetrahymena thermophila SB210]